MTPTYYGVMTPIDQQHVRCPGCGLTTCKNKHLECGGSPEEVCAVIDCGAEATVLDGEEFVCAEHDTFAPLDEGRLHWPKDRSSADEALLHGGTTAVYRAVAVSADPPSEVVATYLTSEPDDRVDVNCAVCGATPRMCMDMPAGCCSGCRVTGGCAHHPHPDADQCKEKHR